MKFIKHLAAASLVVAVIVAAAVLWAHAAGGGNGLPRVPPQQVILRFDQLKAGHIQPRSGGGIDFSHPNDLVRTGIIEAGLAALVIAIDAVRRQRRRRRRITRRAATAA